jgi:hypothetical protein
MTQNNFIKHKTTTSVALIVFGFLGWVLAIFGLLALVVVFNWLTKQVLTSSTNPTPQPLSELEQNLSVATSSATPTPLPLSNELLPPAAECVRAGCSGQLCVDASFALDGMITTCQWQAEFACYQEASCEVQADGRCGFTQSPTLTECLRQYQAPTLTRPVL